MADFTELARSVVVEPDLASALVLFWSSLINEILSVLPYVVALSSQFIFIEEPFVSENLIKLSLFVFLPVSVGAAIGSLPAYALAYFGGKPAIEKFGKHIRLSWSSVEKVHTKFSGSWYDEILFLFLRSIPFLPAIPVSVAAGIMRMHVAPFLVLTIAGTIIRIAIMFVFVVLGVEGVETLAE